MNYIPELHDHIDDDPKATEFLLSSSTKKELKDTISEIVDREFDRLENYASNHIASIAAQRAEAFLRRVLRGDADAAMELLGDATGGSRRVTIGSEKDKPWAQLIYGQLFETDGIRLRREIVEAHADLIRNERIADLESIVEGLTLQIKKLERERG